MSVEVVFRRGASDDLDALYDHIAGGNPERAIGFIRRIRRRCLDLADFPLAGRARHDLRPGLRLVAFERRIVIAYAVTPAQVGILRVFYRGRDVEALIGEIGPEA